MNTFKNIVIEELKQKLEEYEGADMYGSDMAYTLLEEYDYSNSYTYNTKESKDMISKYFDELGEIYDNYIFTYGKESAINPFENPEKFIVLMLLQKASELLSDCEYVFENWSNKVELTEENIDIIKNQLEELK